MSEPFIYLLCVLLGAALGFFIGWLLSTRRLAQESETEKTAIASRLAESESRAAAAEGRLDELRRQISDADRDFDLLRQELSASQTARVAAETRVQESEKAIAEQRVMLEEAKNKLADTFKALAAEALAGNNTGFLTLATEKFSALREDVRSDLDNRKTAIDQLVKPLSESLATFQKQSTELEEKRLKEVSAVGEQLRTVALAVPALQQETSKLVNALKSPQVRGRWGEITLRRTAELAGMSQFCDFKEQVSVDTDTGRLRPDMVVRLPAGREVVVDAKVSLAGYLEALEATTDEQRGIALARHALQIKQHIQGLSSREYWHQFDETPDFVVMFVPNDSVLAAAAEREPDLIESALAKNVIIATPTTFIALLKAIAFGWRQETLAANAQLISQLGQELADRIAVMVDHLARVGRAIDQSTEAYNKAVGSFESRVLPQARKFKELGAGGTKTIDQLETITQVPRLPRGMEIPDLLEEH